MTPAQRDLILHSLGLTPRGKRQRRWSYRNHYCMPVGAPDEDMIVEMTRAGLLEPGRFINGGADRYYHVTRAGAEAAGVLGRVRKEDLR